MASSHISVRIGITVAARTDCAARPVPRRRAGRGRVSEGGVGFLFYEF
jgi:hypothetical protein